MGQADAGDHDVQVRRKARRSGRIRSESRRDRGTEPAGRPPESTAATLTDPQLGRRHTPVASSGFLGIIGLRTGTREVAGDSSSWPRWWPEINIRFHVQGCWLRGRRLHQARSNTHYENNSLSQALCSLRPSLRVAEYTVLIANQRSPHLRPRRRPGRPPARWYHAASVHGPHGQNVVATPGGGRGRAPGRPAGSCPSAPSMAAANLTRPAARPGRFSAWWRTVRRSRPRAVSRW